MKTPRQRGEEFAAAQQQRNPSLTPRDHTIMVNVYAQAFADGASNGDSAGIVRATRDHERARIQGILALPEAKGRERMARHVAFGGDMTADQARAMLALAPQERLASNGLLSAQSDELLQTCLRTAGQPAQSAFSLLMKAEGGTAISNQPGPEPAGSSIAQISPTEIWARRRADEKAARERAAGKV